MNKEAFLLLAEARMLLVPFRIQRFKLAFNLFRHAVRGGSRKRKTRSLQADVADHQMLAAVHFQRQRLGKTDAVEFAADLRPYQATEPVALAPR